MSHNTAQERYLQDVLDGHVALSIALPDGQGGLLGRLRPIVRADADHPEVVQALTAWRNANMASFFGQFVATCERTRAWMLRDLFASGGRLLFLIECDGRLIGHYGFKGLKDGEVLLDNAMLGERATRPGVMRQAGRSLIAWLFDVLQVDKVWGEVLTTNAPALMLNRELGFRVARKIPMLRSEQEGQVTWVPGDEACVDKAEVYCYQLLLEQSQFTQIRSKQAA